MHKDFKNLLMIIGNAGVISKGEEIIFRVMNVVNPRRKMKTPLFQYQIMEAGSKGEGLRKLVRHEQYAAVVGGGGGTEH